MVQAIKVSLPKILHTSFVKSLNLFSSLCRLAGVEKKIILDVTLR